MEVDSATRFHLMAHSGAYLREVEVEYRVFCVHLCDFPQFPAALRCVEDGWKDKEVSGLASRTLAHDVHAIPLLQLCRGENTHMTCV